MRALSDDFEAKFLENDKALGLPAGFTKAQFNVESGLRGDAVSPAGARGWAQIMPATQATLEARAGTKYDPSNIDDALSMHRAVMKENLGKFGNLPDALRAYNGGWNKSKWENSETSAYPYKVMAGMSGGSQSDSQPAGLAGVYKSRAMSPASFKRGDDSDIFSDGPTAQVPQSPQARGSIVAQQGPSAPTGQGDSDIFRDVQTQAPVAPKAPQQREVGGLDRVMALPAGVNRGAAGLAGLPVDTIANALDLGKAAIGYGASKLTGRAPPEWTEPFDRKSVVGSSDWIAGKINSGANAIGVRSPIDNPNPQDTLSRVLYSGGVMAGSSVNPNPAAKVSGMQQMMNAGTGAAGGMLAGVVGEVAPDYAGVAGMLPQLGVMSAAGAFRRGVRGDEAGRQEMAQRIQDFKNAGVDNPSVGLASGNRGVIGIENILAQTPFSSGQYATARQKMVDGMQNRTNQIRDEVSPTRGAAETGAAIQSDLKGAFRDRINTTTRALNDRVEQQIGSDNFTYPTNALATSRAMSTPIPGAPATSGGLINGRIAKIADNLASDVVGTPMPGNPLTNDPLRYKRFDGVVSDTPPGIPYRALKNLRTSIGEEAGSNAIIGTPEQAQFKRLYGAMSEDMRQAVNAADRTNSGVGTGPLQPSQQPGAIALKRANNYYSNAMDKVDDFNTLANRPTPESTYNSVANSLNTGPTIIKQLRGLVSAPTRAKIVSTVIDDLGMAKPGQQGVDGDTWSPKTFLTNYSKMDGQTRTELFKRLPNGAAHAENLRDIAKASDMIGDAGKIWSNPSGTAPALTARGTGYALTVGAFFQPMAAAATAGGLGIANQVSKRLLLNPKFANWLAQAPKVSPDQMQVHMQRLVNASKMSGDNQFKQDVSEYLSAVPSPGDMRGDGQ